jgi:hypothetical protein
MQYESQGQLLGHAVAESFFATLKTELVRAGRDVGDGAGALKEGEAGRFVLAAADDEEVVEAEARGWARDEAFSRFAGERGWSLMRASSSVLPRNTKALARNTTLVTFL